MKTRKGKRSTPSDENSRLDELIEDATVDCYNESEQISGLFTMMEEHLVVPFKTTLLGVEVTVDRIDLTDKEEIVAICRRGQNRQQISILDLPLPRPRPAGAQWIDAYRRWARFR